MVRSDFQRHLDRRDVSEVLECASCIAKVLLLELSDSSYSSSQKQILRDVVAKTNDLSSAVALGLRFYDSEKYRWFSFFQVIPDYLSFVDKNRRLLSSIDPLLLDHVEVIASVHRFYIWENSFG